MIRVPLLLLIAATLLLPQAALANKFRVDLIVFLDREHASAGAGERPAPARAPELAQAFELTDSSGLRGAGIVILPPGQSALSETWRRLDNSRRFQPLLQVSWIQTNPPSGAGPRLRLRHGEVFEAGDMFSPEGVQQVYRVDGTVSLLLNRYLHLDADLAYTEPDRRGDYVSYRLKESRRMRSNETHHLDSPRLGIITRVTRAE